MIRYCVGNKNAAEILYSGKMYSAEEAKVLGLIDEVTTENELMNVATSLAVDLGEKPATAFADIKLLLRKSVGDEMKIREIDSIKRFVEIWYSESTWKKLQDIKIY